MLNLPMWSFKSVFTPFFTVVSIISEKNYSLSEILFLNIWSIFLIDLLTSFNHNHLSIVTFTRKKYMK